MADFLELGAGLVGIVFGWGVTWGATRAKMKETDVRSSTAIQQTDTALRKCAELELANAKLRGDFEQHVAIVRTREEERRTQVSQAWLEERLQDQDRFLTAIAKKTGSIPSMSAVRGPRDERRDDSEPPIPPMRGKLPSRRDDR